MGYSGRKWVKTRICLLCVLFLFVWAGCEANPPEAAELAAAGELSNPMLIPVPPEEPEIESIPDPLPVPEPEQAPDPEPTREPAVSPEPEAEPEPTPPPVPESEPIREPDLESEPESEPESESKPEPESAPDLEPLPPSDANDSNTSPDSADYVLNTNSKKFHYPHCSSVGDMKESNKAFFQGTRDEAIARGYDPCGRCKP